MRIRKKFMTAVLSSLFVLFIFIGSCNSVPVAPNESMVEGVVSEYAVLSSRLVGVRPAMILYRVTVKVESTEKIGGVSDFLSDRVGQDVQFYSKEKISADVFEKRVKIKVTYRGDERGGAFWIREIQMP